MNKEEKIIELLIEEYKLTNKNIEMFLSSQFRILNITLLISGAFAAFTFSSTNAIVNTLITFCPLVLFVILSLIGYHFQRTLALQGYKKYLETKLNSILEENVIFYAHIGMKKMMMSNIFSIINTALYPVIFILTCFFSYKLSPCQSIWLGVAYLFLVSIYFIAIIQTITETKNVEKISYFINSVRNSQKINIDEIDSLIDFYKENLLSFKFRDKKIGNKKTIDKINSII